MLLKFQNNIVHHFPSIHSKHLLLAVSGGIDSIVLAALFLKSNLNFSIVHCNFNLRATESDLDQKFVEAYCLENNIQFFTTSFDTKAFATDYKLSTQIAARKLRYDYFYEVLQKENFDFIATAHHLDDSVETFIINLSRGTGIDGLTGIPLQNDKIIRPLLNFSRSDIEKFAKVNNINWREDASNATDYYVRNKIRHHLAPILRELNPSFSNSFQQTLQNLQQAQSLVDDASRIVYKKVVEDEVDYKKINIEELKLLPNYKAYLYQWLQPLGFTAWQDIYDLVDAESGKKILSEQYQLLKNRNYLIIAPKIGNSTSEFRIHKGTAEVNFHIKLLLCKVSKPFYSTNKTIFVDDEKLSYPLTLRRWKTGDIFHPLGMNGKSKKVSKFFKDEKLSQIEKENAWLLCSGTEIIWVVGLRADERFKISNTTTTLLQIDLIQ
ncbi:tRNA lysidine(34) synthetase TilS [Flavobacterium tegetincola]|uniref:tRNA lysidine(34) synthetase TilS n=1 Tax=Flavobacterium tegetincola TaxID=150172 RepID=UPI00047B8B20|nr:tRNA lysidine(34) synthetase TilS [Flavobacterium tegetincola]